MPIATHRHQHPSTMATTLNAKEQVCIVDQHNNVVGQSDRAVMRQFKLPHRATYIVIKKSSGKFLVQRRTMIKDYCPGFLDPMAGGVVQYGESMEENCEREAFEEMGVRGVSFRSIASFHYCDERTDVWGEIFECTYDGPLALQAEEVDEVLEMTSDEILAQRAKFTPDGIHAFEIYLEHV